MVHGGCTRPMLNDNGKPVMKSGLASEKHTVFTRLQAQAFIYLASTFDSAFIRDWRLFEAGLYCFNHILNDRISKDFHHSDSLLN